MIIIANIGNSNLNYKGLKLLAENFSIEEYLEFYQATRFSFRAATSYIAAKYDHHAADLTEVILSKQLPPANESVSVVLITTDQPDLAYQAGDTCYEGQILQRLLPNQYPQIKEVFLLNFKGTPVSEDDIHRDLLPELRAMVNRLPTTEIIRYSESGGTPQLKTAVKEALRDFLPPHRFDPQYTPFGGEAYSTSNKYSDKQVLMRAARGFISESYDYATAGRLLDQIDKQVAIGPELRELIRVAEYRREFKTSDAIDVLNKYFQADENGKRPIKEAFTSLLPEYWPAALGSILDIKKGEDRLNITEIAHLCQLYLKQKNYSLGIPAYYRLCEEIGECFANGKNYGVKTKRFLTDNERLVCSKFSLVEARPGVPFILAYTSLVCSQEMKQLVEELINTISHVNGFEFKGLNQLRNRCFLAHGTNGISEAAVKADNKTFLTPRTGRAARIFQLLGLPDAENNVYDQMNKEILVLFAQE